MLCRAFVVLLIVGMSGGVSGVVEAGPCWSPPAAGRIVDPYRPPACPYCAGNRGIEYRVAGGSVVRAVAAGEVTWAGSIAGVRWVVVRHANGWRATYGRLESSSLSRGDRVLTRGRIGIASGELYFGLRIDSRYVDPAPYLGRLIGRPRLVPIDGSTPRRSPAPVLRCGR